MNFVKRFEANTQGRDFIVGDLHGCYDDLLWMMNKIGFNKEVDRMFSVGDLVDRGRQSLECANLIFEPWFHAVRGNHEQMMIDAMAGNEYTFGVWVSNGGFWHLSHEQYLMKDLAESLSQLPYVIVVGEGDNRVNIVHAEILNATDVDIDNLACFEQKNLDEMIWGRNLIMYASHYLEPEALKNYQNDLSLTVCGHTPVKQATRVCNQLFIDGGCVYHTINKNTTSHDLRLIMYNINEKKVLEYIPAIGEVLETPLENVKQT